MEQKNQSDSRKPTPAKECCDTKKGFGKCKHDEPTPATASEQGAVVRIKSLVCSGEWYHPDIRDRIIDICDSALSQRPTPATASEDEWFDDSPAAKKPDSPLVENYLRMFVQDILHGDEDHRKWLLEAVECFIEGKHMPERP